MSIKVTLAARAADMRSASSKPQFSLPPGPRLPKVIQGWQMSAQMPEFFERCARKFGDAFTVSMPGIPPQVVFAHPDAVRQIFSGDPQQFLAGQANAVPLGGLLGADSLILLDGGRHAAHRRVLLPPLHGDRLRSQVVAIRSIAENVLKRLPVGAPFKVFPEVHKIALRAIMQTVIGTDDRTKSEKLLGLLTLLSRSFASPMLLAPWLRFNLGFLTPWTAFLRLKERIHNFVAEEITRRRGFSGSVREDILSLLLDARDECGARLSDTQIRDELLTLLVAGSDTTASAMSWAIYNIAQDPKVADKIIGELDTVIGRRAIEWEHLPKLKYLEAVVKETLRLHPVVLASMRKLGYPASIGGYHLPAGVLVAPCSYLSHRRQGAWVDPLKFSAERFLDVRPDPCVYFPFGGGDRLCVGMSYALLELKLVLALLLRRVRIRLLVGYQAHQVRRSVTYAPSEGLPIIAELLQ
jgi:cytochrome P450